MSWWGKVKKHGLFSSQAYAAADPTGLLPGGQDLYKKDWYKSADVLGILPGGKRPFWESEDPSGVDPEIRQATIQGYMAPTETAAYQAMAKEAAIKSAAQRQQTAGAYASRGLGQSGYSEAAQQQVTMNEQRALSDAIARIQMGHLNAMTGVRGQDLQAAAQQEGFLGQMIEVGGQLIPIGLMLALSMGGMPGIGAAGGIGKLSGKI